jgi:hypothetical protein
MEFKMKKYNPFKQLIVECKIGKQKMTEEVITLQGFVKFVVQNKNFDLENYRNDPLWNDFRNFLKVALRQYKRMKYAKNISGMIEDESKMFKEFWQFLTADSKKKIVALAKKLDAEGV